MKFSNKIFVVGLFVCLILLLGVGLVRNRVLFKRNGDVKGTYTAQRVSTVTTASCRPLNQTCGTTTAQATCCSGLVCARVETNNPRVPNMVCLRPTAKPVQCEGRYEQCGVAGVTCCSGLTCVAVPGSNNRHSWCDIRPTAQPTSARVPTHTPFPAPRTRVRVRTPQGGSATLTHNHVCNARWDGAFPKGSVATDNPSCLRNTSDRTISFINYPYNYPGKAGIAVVRNTGYVPYRIVGVTPYPAAGFLRTTLKDGFIYSDTSDVYGWDTVPKWSPNTRQIDLVVVTITQAPTRTPTRTPTRAMTSVPTRTPTKPPAMPPTAILTRTPTPRPPTPTPTRTPTAIPTKPPAIPPVATIVPTVAPTSNPCVLQPRGDANCDGVLNWLDFVIFRNAFLGQPPQTGHYPDFSGDGKVTLLDLEIWRGNTSQMR